MKRCQRLEIHGLAACSHVARKLDAALLETKTERLQSHTPGYACWFALFDVRERDKLWTHIPVSVVLASSCAGDQARYRRADLAGDNCRGPKYWWGLARKMISMLGGPAPDRDMNFRALPFGSVSLGLDIGNTHAPSRFRQFFFVPRTPYSGRYVKLLMRPTSELLAQSKVQSRFRQSRERVDGSLCGVVSARLICLRCLRQKRFSR